MTHTKRFPLYTLQGFIPLLFTVVTQPLYDNKTAYHLSEKNYEEEACIQCSNTEQTSNDLQI